MTKKEQIETSILDLLAGIRLGNSIVVSDNNTYSYQTDAGLNVFREIEYTENPDINTFIAAFYGEHSTYSSGPEGVPFGYEHHDFSITIEGMIPDDKAGTAGEKLRRDICQTVRSSLFCAGLLLQYPIGLTSSSVVNQGEDVFSGVKVSFSVKYRTLKGAE